MNAILSITGVSTAMFGILLVIECDAEYITDVRTARFWVFSECDTE